jgi:hypothetical protein
MQGKAVSNVPLPVAVSLMQATAGQLDWRRQRPPACHPSPLFRLSMPFMFSSFSSTTAPAPSHLFSTLGGSGQGAHAGVPSALRPGRPLRHASQAYRSFSNVSHHGTVDEPFCSLFYCLCTVELSRRPLFRAEAN